MSAATFRVDLASQKPLPGCLEITVELNTKQRLHALRALLGDMPQEEAAKFIRAEFPELFEGATA